MFENAGQIVVFPLPQNDERQGSFGNDTGANSELLAKFYSRNQARRANSRVLI